MHANFLILNLEKTKIMLVGTHQRTAEADDLVIEITNTRLERVNKFQISWGPPKRHSILEGPHRI